MGQNDYVQTGVILFCDKGAIPTPLIASPKKQNHHGTMGATIRDNIPCMNILPFGVCIVTRMPCIPVMPQWQNYPKKPWFIEGAQPLLMKSYCRCQVGGTIRILPSLNFAAIMASLDDLANQASGLKDQVVKMWNDTIFPIVGEAVGTALLMPIGGILKATGHEDICRGFGKGFLKGVANTVVGIVEMANPINQIEMIGGLATLGATAQVANASVLMGMSQEEGLGKFDELFGTTLSATHEGVKQAVNDTMTEGKRLWNEGTAEEWADVGGQATVFVLDIVVGGKGMGSVSKGMKAGKQASNINKVNKASHLLDVNKLTSSFKNGWLKKLPGATKGIFKKAATKMRNKLSGWTKSLRDKLRRLFRDPVDIVTGAVIYEGTDFEFPGPIPLAWKRSWYSDSRWEGILGHGCHWNYDMRIQPMQDEEGAFLGVTLSDGRPAIFDNIQPGEQCFNRDEKLTLHHRHTHYELFNHEERHTYVFPITNAGWEELVLTSVRNEAGHEIQIHYQSGHLKEVIDSAGRRFMVTTDKKKRVTKVELYVDELRSETLVGYEYNHAGDMISITNALDKTTRLVYENHLMVKKTDRAGHSFYWEYDGTTSDARCIHTWGDGGILEGWLEFGDGYTIVTDNQGNKTRYEYAEEGFVTDEIDPLGSRQQKLYSLHTEVIEETDADGRKTQYDYDYHTGRLLAVTRPGGDIQQYAYTPEGRLASETTPGGATTRYEYNEQGVLSKVIAANNQTTEYIYNEHNLISRIYAPGKRDISLSYDAHYNLIKAEFPDGMYSEWTYDHRGQVTSHRNASGGQEKYVYDALGRVTRLHTPDGNHVRLVYNAYEEVIRAEDATRSVEFEYTPLGLLTKRKENGHSINFDYDKDERLTSLRNEAGETYTFERDKAGRIIRESGFDGLTRHYKRTPGGAVQRVERPGGKKDDYVYDKAGRLCGIEYHDGTFEQYAYNEDGLLTEARNPGSTVKITRDHSGRITEEWQDGHTVSSRYDKLSQRIQVTSSLGANLSSGYTRSGQLEHMKSGHWEMALGYNDRGQEISRSLTGGIFSSNSHDEAGRVTHHTVMSRMYRTRSIRYQWGVNDRLITTFNEQTDKKTTFSYDQAGFLTGAQYDTERLFRVPDAVGNLFKTSNRSDRKYGPGGRLLKTEDTKYTYDDEGNLIGKIKSNGDHWQYHWNANSSLKEVIRPDRKKVAFTYDALGRRIQKTYNKKTTRWVWDGNTPLHEWIEETEQPEITTWVFDEGHFSPAAKLIGNKSYSIVTDYLGTPVQAYDESGRLKWETELDIYGKVRTFEGDKALIPFRYQGQYEDAETGLYYNRFRYYSPDEGMYLSQDPIGLAGGNPTIYGYVKDVNCWVDVLGLMPKIPTKVKNSDVKSILSGNDVTVGSIKEADALLKASLPDAVKVPGAKDGTPNWDNFKGKRPGGIYHKDYNIDKTTGRIVGHGPGNPHGKMKHINIKLSDGNKVAILIEPNSKSKALFSITCR